MDGGRSSQVQGCSPWGESGEESRLQGRAGGLAMRELKFDLGLGYILEASPGPGIAADPVLEELPQLRMNPDKLRSRTR